MHPVATLRRLALGTALLSTAVLAACSSISFPPDGGGGVDAARDAALDTSSDRAVVVGPPDTGIDARDVVHREAGSSQRFDPCDIDADCAAGLSCDTRYPGGRCLSGCITSADCPSGSHCFQDACRPACEAAQGGCGASEVCVSVPSDPVAQMVCVPSCYLDPTHLPACNDGLTCDPFTGDCVIAPAVAGREVGDPCVVDADCRTLECVPDAPGLGTVGGYCINIARSPAPAAFVSGQPWPQTNCPPGSLPEPVGGVPVGEGYPAFCLRRCTANGDCRAGYGCFPAPATPSGMTSDGTCRPIDCLDAEHSALANHGCPTGYTCQMVTNTTIGVCSH